MAMFFFYHLLLSPLLIPFLFLQLIMAKFDISSQIHFPRDYSNWTDFECCYWCSASASVSLSWRCCHPGPGPAMFFFVKSQCLNQSINSNGFYLREKSPIQMQISMSKTIPISFGYQGGIPEGAGYKSTPASQPLTTVSDFDCHYQFFSWAVAFSTRTLAGSKAWSASLGADEM